VPVRRLRSVGFARPGAARGIRALYLDSGCCPLALAGECFALIESNWTKRSFQMGVAGWRFAHGKRNLSGRAAVVAALENWQVICSAVVAASSMIMLGIMLYNDLQ